MCDRAYSKVIVPVKPGDTVTEHFYSLQIK